MNRLLAICHRFNSWKPALAKLTVPDRSIVKRVSQNLKLDTFHYIGPDGPFHIRFYEIQPMHEVVSSITSKMREQLGSEVWRNLREQMSKRFVGHGFDGLVESIPRHQSLAFFGPSGNPHQLVAIVEDLLLTAFCLAHSESPDQHDSEVLADLLELFLRGIYPMGMTCSEDAEISVLILLNGSDPLLASTNP